ncbi:hypothetical protein OESDEN_13757 [Oesophagostomum dentatum]|uniref:Uncharacterized protein n=1 Tax=Oesophagostomum dentatum TaxID=61180 RepID=A0A0B1SNH1_OESDE|nr:hypothetical protein OESDEN_13757 [Oesophagostomum dentatum]
MELPLIVVKCCILCEFCLSGLRVPSAFLARLKNINVHPLHLTHLDGVEVLNKEVVAAKNLSISLSERPFAKTVDRFRRKTLEEIKREMFRTTRTVTEEYNEAANGDVEKSMGGINTLKFFAREQKSRVPCLVYFHAVGWQQKMNCF